MYLHSLMPVGTCKHEVCLSSLLYLSFLLVRTTRLLADQAFTNMGQPMHWWLHWKYHFAWSDPCTISLGVGVVFAFSWFACMLLCLFCFFVCLLACLITHFSFTFAYASTFLCCLFSCFVHRLVSHETMYDSWNKLGKIQEALYNYHYLVICDKNLYMKNLLLLIHDMSMENMYCSKWTLGKTQCLHTN